MVGHHRVAALLQDDWVDAHAREVMTSVLDWLARYEGTAPGSVDSLPVRLRPRWKDQQCAKPYPAKFRRDVIAVAGHE